MTISSAQSRKIEAQGMLPHFQSLDAYTLANVNRSLYARLHVFYSPCHHEIAHALFRDSVDHEHVARFG